MYKVVYQFKDLKDKDHIYNVGDEYPREGAQPTIARIKELSGDTNKIGKPLIVEVPQEETEPKTEDKPKPKRSRKKAEESE